MSEQRDEPGQPAESAEPGGEERRTVSDPTALKALAHPLRQRILRHLGVSGPATSTTLAAALDENTGTLSYHLRRLERGGFIEDIPERAGGRERWWRAVRGLDVRRPALEELTDGERAVVSTLDRMRMAEDLELARRYLANEAEPDAFLRGSRSLSHLTREELDAFHDAYLELLARFSRGPEDAAPSARPVALRWFGVSVE
ncbi:ArsR/SmtB family transcription factor [Streptomyces litchfieldiae]|uniref:Helix-turn-helix domain-containing protein n=1 Tax=Streptomyces litchfieldiae TaxID=3075543 RepID=A0ABU2MQG6_9ACTN|nr:helix-turn-helix domain-containing protein [Streptomyces sp. DSM 44938]MDT0343148.1 helix-turn-helix domain-containing protein [Streptomyces sp. DSM 44938]